MFLVSFDSALVIFIAAALFLFCPDRWRWLFLLVLSCGLLLFGAPKAFLIAAVQTVAAYGMGLWLGRGPRTWALWLCVALQMLPLFFFKWQGMYKGDPAMAAAWVVPLGLSFYTFQILSYLIEIQWGRVRPERNLARFASYILFFANKVAGPIERPGLLKQMLSIETPQPQELARSALWIWTGLFQKFVLADRLGEYVEPVFNNPLNYSGLTASVAVLLSKYQIFCDFSGISLIALGVGGLFGLKLTRNFERPFAATTLREFWTRWHISLQAWIRDYVFFPLLSTPLARFGVFPLLVITFVLFGLWHDWRWTFVVYGISQAVLLKLEPTRFLKRFGWPVMMVFNYIFLICLPSVLFRAPTLEHAFDVWRSLGFDLKNWKFFLDLGGLSLVTMAGLVIAHEVLQWSEARFDLYSRLARLPWLAKMVLTVVLLVVLVVYSKFDPESVFIYSQF